MIMKPIPEKRDYRGSWKIRRRFMFAVCLFSMYCIAYCMYHNLTSRVAETIVEMAFITLISVIGSYVFGAAWQDIKLGNKRKEDGD